MGKITHNSPVPKKSGSFIITGVAYYSTVKINLKGGIVSPGALLKILITAKEAHVLTASVSSRQQLVLKIPGIKLNSAALRLSAIHTDFETGSDEFPNVVSSYPGAVIFHAHSWLSEGIYQDILNGFTFRPRLKINISDDRQSFTPFFTGNLNFIASNHPNFWYLYVRYPKQNEIFCWDDLIYSNEIPVISESIEKALMKDVAPPSKETLKNRVYEERKFITLKYDAPPALPHFMLPYYEGFNRYGDKTWLGIYRRDDRYPIDFLIDLCNLCSQTQIGQICMTPWRSMIVKGIDLEDRLKWDDLLGKHNINIRHASLELNWQFTDEDPKDFELKQFLVNELDRRDARVYGLCFAVKSQRKSEVFGSVIIRRKPLIKVGDIPIMEVYDLKYRDQFNPNSRKVHLFKKNLIKSELATCILLLYKKFYEERSSISKKQMVDHDDSPEKKEASFIQKDVFYCKHCLTRYDEDYGDPENDIPPGILYEDLPAGYYCSVCDSPKGEFTLLSEDAVSAV